MSSPIELDRLLGGITPELAIGDGGGVRVAILDGHISCRSPDLAERLAESVRMCAVRSEPSESSGRVSTSVRDTWRAQPTPATLTESAHAAAAGRILLSLAPRAELLSIDVLGTAEPPTGVQIHPDAVVAGIRWAISRGCRVITVSVGLERTRLVAASRMALALAVEEAYWSDAVVVAAAHPGHPSVAGLPATLAGPASAAWRIFESPEHFHYVLEAQIEFAAHARAELAGRAEQSPGFPAPHLAGWVARLLSRYPTLKPFEVKTILYRLAEHLRRRQSPSPAVAIEPRT